MTVSPFYTGGETHHDQYGRTSNFGISFNFSVQLDGGMVEQCKAIAKRHEQKMRLDYELVRALKCAELGKAGFMFNPKSTFAKLCADVIPIVAYEKAQQKKKQSFNWQPPSW